ncbi:probable protein S-acyltransferase 22 isoform X2 [Pyrus x bretschneideri]|uniref:probable protein S-acyltransferase 22 isoform X2 n=1 Tax=Pyrus x bretschneideri TaxID=225117 RepID=UPI0020304059|nr:probable protein S-acyltransferase 22 isoform X2 [Pyrus x bretschneideri]
MSAIAPVQVRNLCNKVKTACSIAAYVKLRFTSTASTAEFVTNVLTSSIITAGGLTTVLAKRITDNFSPLWLLLSSCLSWFLYPIFSVIMPKSNKPEPEDRLRVSIFIFKSLSFELIIDRYVHGLCTMCLRLQLILQWSTGIFVIICCIIERKHISVDISSKLGSSFSLAPFIIVVAACSLLAMIATLPLAQLFFFHILLVKKGISTYDYIIALREQEQEQQGVGGQQSAQMSPASSLTGLSSASSFNTFHRGAWCTPPRLFLEDQFDVVPPETGSVSSCGKKMVGGEPVKKKNAPVKISPWTLARLNAEEVSKAAAEARKKSKILQPVRRDAPFVLERDSSFGGTSGRRMVPRPDNNRRRPTKRVRLPADLPMESITKGSAIVVDKGFTETSTSLAPLQLEARSAFQTSRAMSSSTGIVASSPESSLDSPDIHPFRVSSSGAEEARRLTGLPAGAIAAGQRGIPLSRSTSDGYEGYEASGGEDSDRVPTRIVQRSTNRSNLLFGSDQDERVVKLNASSSSGLAYTRKL